MKETTTTPETAAGSAEQSGPVQQRIETLLDAAFSLQHLEVQNESSGHNVPAGSETHFKVVLVDAAFAQRTRIERHRAVHAVLQAELQAGVHALAIHTYSPQEWSSRFGNAPMSPPCLGGKAREAGESTP